MKTVRCVPKQWARWNSSYFTPRRLALTTLRSCRSRSPRSWCTSSRDFSSSSNRGKHRIMTDLNNDDVRQRCAPKRASQQGADDKPTSSPYLQTPSGAVAPSQPRTHRCRRQERERYRPWRLIDSERDGIICSALVVLPVQISHLLNPRTHRRGGSRGSVSIHHLQNPRRLSYIAVSPSVYLLFSLRCPLFSRSPLLRTTTAPLFVYIHPNRTIDVFLLSLGKSTIQLTCTNSIDSLLPPPSSIIS